MHLLILFLASMTLVSCGESAATSKNRNLSKVNGYLDLSNGLVGSSDLLTVTLDVPIEISGDQIIIKNTRSGQDVGESITCSAIFTEGESYQYQVSHQRLVLRNSTGTYYTLNRMGNHGNDIIGTWTWAGKENGMSIHRRISIPNAGRMIMNMDCES